MKQQRKRETKLHQYMFLGLVCSFLAGCASTPEQAKDQAGMSKEQILQQDDVKGKTPVVFAQPLEKVREAAIRSLVFVGCEMKKQEPYFVSGRRPNKFGLFVGSGGETVKVFLYPQAENETHVWVDTDLSFVGIAGQQSWNTQVLNQLTNLLNQPQPAKAQ